MITYCPLQRHLVDSHSEEDSSGCQNINKNTVKSCISKNLLQLSKVLLINQSGISQSPGDDDRWPGVNAVAAAWTSTVTTGGAASAVITMSPADTNTPFIHQMTLTFRQPPMPSY